MKLNIKLTSLNNKQRSIAKSISDTPASKTKYHVIRASRQSGKTWLLERLAFFLAFLINNQEGAIIMATNSQTRKVFRSMLKWIPKDVINQTNNTDGSRFIVFENGTIINFFSSNSYDSVAGNSFDFMICDEFALWNRHAWGIIKPTLAAKPNAKVIIASTPRGKNDFYQMCMQGMDEDDLFVREYRMTYKDNEHYDLREIEDAKKNMPEELFKQEYLAEFVDGISMVFDSFDVVQTINNYKKLNGKHYFGIDVAGDGEDKTVLTIINENGTVEAIHHIDESNIIKQSNIIKSILKPYNNITGYVECNGIGKGLYDAIGLKNTFKFHTTNDNKQEMVIETIKDIAEGKLSLPTSELCPELDYEMSMYMGVRLPSGKIRYTHPVGEHDDYVDSLMMANKARHKLKSTGNAVRVNPYRRSGRYNYKV